MSSSPTAPTSTTGSSTSSGSERTALIACGAIAQPCKEIVDPARLAGRRPPAAAAAAQPAPADRRRGAPAGGRAARRRTPPSSSGTPTAGRTAPSTRSATSSAWPGCPGLHCYDLYAGPSQHRDVLRRAAGHLPAHRLPGPVVRADRRAGARPGPLAGAARRLLRPLHAGGVAGPGSRTTSCAAGRRGGGRIGLPLTVVETGDAGSRRRWPNCRRVTCRMRPPDRPRLRGPAQLRRLYRDLLGYEYRPATRRPRTARTGWSSAAGEATARVPGNGVRPAGVDARPDRPATSR